MIPIALTLAALWLYAAYHIRRAPRAMEIPGVGFVSLSRNGTRPAVRSRPTRTEQRTATKDTILDLGVRGVTDL